MIAPVRLPSPASVRTGRVSSLLFHWRAADLDVTQALSGQALTFARAGGDAYVKDANGRIYVAPYGVPRFEMVDYPDASGAIVKTPGLVLEVGQSNIILQSDDLSNASWTKTRSSAVQVSGAAPDGGALSLLKEDATASNSHVATQVVTITANNYLTISAYVVAKERFRGRLQALNGADSFGVDFDLSAVTTVAQTAGAGVNVDKGIVVVGTCPAGTIYRIWASGRVNAASTAITIQAVLEDASGASSYNGDGASGMYWWRVDCKQGSSAGSEVWTGIKTTTATVTRLAESLAASIAWPFQDQITLYAKAARPDWYLHSGSLVTSHYLLSLGSAAPYLRLGYNATSRIVFAQINDGSGNTSVTLNQPTTTPNELCMQATGLKSGGTVRLDVGAGFGAPSAVVAPFTALGDAVLQVGAFSATNGLLGTPLHTLKIASGLRSLTEMQRMF